MGKKILLIDDNMKHDKVMKDLLEESGYPDVVIATSGEDGVKKAKALMPDLVIIDTLLPGIDGFETCRKIREDAGRDKPKIVMMTGYIDAIDAVKAREMGADDYVVKTSDFSLVINVMKRLI